MKEDAPASDTLELASLAHQTFPSIIPSKRLRSKGSIGGIMQKIDNLNRPEGKLDGHGLAGYGGGYTETFPYNQELGRDEPRMPWHCSSLTSHWERDPLDFRPDVITM
jgi:hypothetical protein